MVAWLMGMKEEGKGTLPPPIPSKQLSYLGIGYLENLKVAQILPSFNPRYLNLGFLPGSVLHPLGLYHHLACYTRVQLVSACH